MDDYTLKAIQATERASDRGRSILLIIQVTCIVVFMAFWHESPFSWTAARIQLAKAVLWKLNCSDKHPEFPLTTKPAETDSTATPVDVELVKAAMATYQAEYHINCHMEHADTAFSEELRNRADDYLHDSKTVPLAAQKTLELLQEANVNHNINISVPFLGITFDINDLSLLGGITFMFLLLWYRFSLWREDSNIRSLFEYSSKVDLPEVYRLLSMTQVLTVPPQPDGKKKGFWGSLAGVLLWSPVVVQLLVVLNDLISLRQGMTLSPRIAIGEVVLGWLLLGLLVGITIQCQGLSSAIDQQWSEAFKRISDTPKP